MSPVTNHETKNCTESLKNKMLLDIYEILHDEELTERLTILTRLFFKWCDSDKIGKTFFFLFGSILKLRWPEC